MSQGKFSDLMIRLEAFKRIFLFRPKIDFLPKGKPKILGQNNQLFKSAFLTFFMSLGISAFRKTPLGMILKCI